jgi:hypothetical protein
MQKSWAQATVSAVWQLIVIGYDEDISQVAETLWEGQVETSLY